MDNKQFIRNLYQGFLHRDPEPGAMEHWNRCIEAGMDLNQIMNTFLQSDEHKAVGEKARNLFVPPGHFYSPIVNVDEVRDLFSPPQPIPPGLSALRVEKETHLATWNKLLPYLKDIPFPSKKSDGFRYYFENPAFSYGDGSVLHAMLRAYRPRRLIEVGSGYSSACAVDTIERYLDDVDVSFVEPYPKLLIELLGEEAVDQVSIHATGVQQADIELFKSLDDGDILFIDSTHVMKTGSDVCHELFNILPVLKPGVLIHFHDIFWPFEYGKNWVLEQNRSWNEIYGLRAFLMYNNAFDVIFHNDFFVKTCRDVVQRDYPQMLKNSGGSIWLRKTQ